MDRLSSEILPSIFKRLSSLQMVLVMRVCREWLEIIDNTRALWTELVLPDEKQGIELKSLDLFDRKSGSTLTQVSMNVEAVREKAVKAAFIDILKKSKETLQVLNVPGSLYTFEERFWDYPKLVDCRVHTSSLQKVQFRLSKRGKEFGVQDDQGSPLRVLWTFDLTSAFDSHLNLLNRLVSLSVSVAYDSLSWRKILEVPAQSLRHLQITLLDDVQEHSISTLELPNLGILDLNVFGLCRNFPTWLKCPSSATLSIQDVDLLPLLPSCSRLWTNELSNMDELQARCPELSELRLNSKLSYPESLYPANCKKLIYMLRQRKSNVEAGMEVDGVKMIALKTLFLPLKLVKEGIVPLLSDLVEEVVDLESVPGFIELEV